MLDNVLKNGQKIYCQTQEEVDFFMDVAEAKDLRWIDGEKPRHYDDGFPIIYIIDGRSRLEFDNEISARKINEAIPASELRNYAISIRAKRG